MAQFTVLGYALQISTNPPAEVPGTPPPEFIPRVTIVIQTPEGHRSIPLPIKGAAEFMALCAMMQVPGRLLFEDVQGTLDKISP
jgi:hypothetical protein